MSLLYALIVGSSAAIGGFTHLIRKNARTDDGVLDAAIVGLVASSILAGVSTTFLAATIFAPIWPESQTHEEAQKQEQTTGLRRQPPQFKESTKTKHLRQLRERNKHQERF